MQKFQKFQMEYNPYLQLVFSPCYYIKSWYYPEGSKTGNLLYNVRLLKRVNVALILIIKATFAFSAMAIAIHLFNPDEGKCGSLVTYETCVVPRSNFDSSKSLCSWEHGEDCFFEPPSNDESFKWILVLVALVSFGISFAIATLHLFTSTIF